MKHTRRDDPTHPDCKELEKALSKIKEVMTHLNEEKRQTEGQIHIFDIYSEIENCPASVVSSHRSFVTRADCVELASHSALTSLMTQEVLEANGGRIAGGLEDVETTHLVVDDDAIKTMPFELETRMKEAVTNKRDKQCHVVKRDWFWRSIQIEAAANPSNYRVKTSSAVISPTNSIKQFSPTPTQLSSIAVSTSNKRRMMRRQEILHILARESPVSKRRSSVNDLAALNLSGSLLDSTDPRILESVGRRV